MPSLVERAQADPVWWLQRAFGATFWQRQREILESFRDNQITIVPSCNGSGKTFVAAHAALWALYTHKNAKVVTTGVTWNQIQNAIWGEIRNAHQNAKIPLGVAEANTVDLKLGPNWTCIGVSTNDPVALQGIHAHGGTWIIAEEADGIPPEIWAAIKGNMTGQGCHLLAILNPIDPESYVARVLMHDPRANVLPIDAFCTPNFTAFGVNMSDLRTGAWREKITGEYPQPWLVTPEWAAAELVTEGEDSPFIKSRVCAQWPDVAEDALIKHAWIEAAWARWRDAESSSEVKEKQEAGPRAIGHDVARFGDDKTVTAIRRGARLFVASAGSGLDTEQCGAQALRLEVLEHMAMRGQKPPVFVDVAGVGAGVYDMLKQHCKAIAVDNATKASEPEKFFNRRAELYWNLRELLRTEEMALDPTDRQLAQELRAVRFKINKSRVQIEEKAEIKKRLGRSPDRADAIVLACAGDSHVAVSFLEAMTAARGAQR